MRVIPDFKTTKVAAEFRKAFGRKARLPKAAMKTLTASLNRVVKSGPATVITGSPEDGLVVTIVSSATGKRIHHLVRLDENLAAIGHEEKDAGEPINPRATGTDDLWPRKMARRATENDIENERKWNPPSD